ncbi:MAG: cytochrome d ubiquinol oxidase subunit II [Ignavibacteria bacterium]|jgi:cytochrome d ubiquinol oxidase subunit II|nr:cytochrome d ubiquinol oxidase subunit II [Ignavibacteria bacterium]
MDLNIIWFVLIIVLLIGYAVLDGFVLGVGTIYLSVKGDKERRILLRSIGPFWNGNEVWLVAGGGALFAAFPVVYASLFSGFYIPLILLLFSIIFRAIAIEFRNKEDSKLWKSFWDISLSVASILILLLFGVAVGNLIIGLPIADDGYFRINVFELFTPFPILVGLLSVFFFAMHGSIYAAMKTENELQINIVKKIKISWIIATIVYFLTAALVQFDIIAGDLLIISGIFLLILPIFVRKNKFGVAFVISSLFAVSYIANIAFNVFPNWLLSTTSSEANINIYNGASSEYTLKIMLIIAIIGVPFVLAYTIWVYSKFRGKVRLEEQKK